MTSGPIEPCGIHELSGKSNPIRYSVVIPVYNCGSILYQCVNSILNVRLPGMEIILIDDGSTQETALLCDTISNKYPSVRSIHQVNQGVSAARNRGMAEARGKWLFFVDSDDTLESSSLRELLLRLENEPDADLIVFGMTFDYYFHGICYRKDQKSFPYEGMMPKDICGNNWMNLQRENYWVSAGNKIFRLEMLHDNNIFFPDDMFIFEDFIFSLRVLSICDRIYVSKETIYHYRQSEDEKNSWRRLLHISHLDSIIDRIAIELETVFSHMSIDLLVQDYLYQFYLMLARMKISVCKLKEIPVICKDFSEWQDRTFIDKSIVSGSFANDLIQQNYIRLVFRRIKSSIRHHIAIRVKTLRHCICLNKE